MGPDVKLIDSAAETARALDSVLERESLAAPPGATADHRFAVSDDAARFLSVGSRFLGDRLMDAEVVAWQDA
jgi:glutamate racemase